MTSIYFRIFIFIIIVNFVVSSILEKIPCGRLFVKDALENCGSAISFPICEEVASQCCGHFAQCPLSQVLKCCNNGT